MGEVRERKGEEVGGVIRDMKGELGVRVVGRGKEIEMC